jgi:class 3 adenylate cyclase
MENHFRFFWPFNVRYEDILASEIYRELRGICLAAVVWPIVAGTFLFYFGLSLTAHQQFLGLTMIVPGGGVVLLIVGNYLLQRDFRPIKLFLDTPPEQVDTRIATEALIQARNFQLLSARRVLLYQAPAFGLGFSLMTLIANLFMGLGLEFWQLLIALMVAFMVGIGHAIFEFYAVAKLMVQVITLAHEQCGDLTDEQRLRVIRVDTKRKLLFVSGLIVMTPMIILGTTLLIRIRHELHQAALIDQLDMIMPGMIGWMFLIVTIGSIMSLRIFLRMASDTSDSLQELSEAMKKVEEGSLDISLLERTSDEYAGIYRRFNRMVKELIERERLRDAFGRYVAQELADDVMQHGSGLSSKEVKASVLFADIRDFTAMSEKMSAEEVVNLLNQYFNAVEPAIKAEGGWINKFGGDSLLAVFGVLTPQSDHIQHAVQAALKMRAALHKFNIEQEKSGKHPLRIGIGIHCGEMVAGSVGSHDRMEFTVIGDAVNMASRIEGLNKKWGTDILISEDVAKATKCAIDLETMPETRVHGISNPIQVFAIK